MAMNPQEQEANTLCKGCGHAAHDSHDCTHFFPPSRRPGGNPGLPVKCMCDEGRR